MLVDFLNRQLDGPLEEVEVVVGGYKGVDDGFFEVVGADSAAPAGAVAGAVLGAANVVAVEAVPAVSACANVGSATAGAAVSPLSR